MRTRIGLVMGLILLGSASQAPAQDVIWRAAKPVTLGVPTALPAVDAPSVPPRVVRGQMPPPPPFPGTGGPPVFPTPGGAGSADLYNKGVVTNDADLGSFWVRTGDKFKRCWEDVSGGAQDAFKGDKMFKGDTCFPNLASPVTNPFFFEDPRALTELRPVFIWQRTPNANPVWGGGSNFDYTLTGSVALTPHISLVLNRLGFTTMDPKVGTPNFSAATGFSEVMLGPKITFLQNESSGTVAAFGLTFDIPAGSSSVQQNTGSLMLIPYFTIAQSFGRVKDGAFTFMNTTGYTFRTDSTRTEAFYSSFHLDYDWGGAHRFYPLIEMNWRHYTRNGGVNPISFDGNDLANFGAQNVSGNNELTLALGSRVKLNNFIWWGIAGEFNVLSNSGGQHLDQFRLTTDFIFRY